MSEVEQTEQYLKALEAFVVNNPDLERLEALLDRFNIFEAVGMERQEIRHSRFLAFLLDPNESHGMGDDFVKRLLQRAVTDAPGVSVPVTPIELSLWDLGKMSVRREWRRIDIFLLDEREKLAVIIENKIGAGEHGDQLDRYHKAVREEYPDHKLLALYLTPGGDEPSHPAYLPVDYRAVCEILDSLAESRTSVIEPDLRVLIAHYTGMLRRHIVGDSEIARLSRQIYQKHQRAIDLIYQHRSNFERENKDIVESLIHELPQLTYTGRYKNVYSFFYLSNWQVPALNTEERGDFRGFLRFVFHNRGNELTLKLETSPGDEASSQRLYEMAQRQDDWIFRNAQPPNNNGYTHIYDRKFLTPEFCESATDTEREAEIRKNWDDFLESDLPRIDAALK